MLIYKAIPLCAALSRGSFDSGCWLDCLLPRLAPHSLPDTDLSYNGHSRTLLVEASIASNCCPRSGKAWARILVPHREVVDLHRAVAYRSGAEYHEGLPGFVSMSSPSHNPGEVVLQVSPRAKSIEQKYLPHNEKRTQVAKAPSRPAGRAGFLPRRHESGGFSGGELRIILLAL